MVANTLQLGKHAKNARGIRWEQKGKLMGTHWEQQRSNSRPSPKRQKNMAHLVAWNHLIGCKKVFLPAHILCNFGPRLMVGA